MKKSVVRINHGGDSEDALVHAIFSLSSENFESLKDTVTYNALKRLRADPKTYDHLKVLAGLSIEDIDMYEVGDGWEMSLDKKEKETYRAALFFAKKEMSVRFVTRSKNTNLLFIGGEESGYIAAIKGFRFADIGKDENEWEGNTIVYFFGARESKSMVMAAIEWGTPGCTNRDDAMRLICAFISKYGAIQYCLRVCCVCNKIGDAKEFRYCRCDRERRYCSAACQSSDWVMHRPEHVLKMQALSTKAEDADVVSAADFEQLSVSVSEERASLTSLQGAASSAVENHTCVVCGEHSTLVCPCGTRYCSRSCQSKAWPAHKMGCSSRKKV
jgi:hypothetical protein